MSFRDDETSTLDFIGTINELFDEAQERGYKPQHELEHIKPIIVNFLLKCNVSVAKARAGFALSFSDGREPQTHVGYPPSGLVLDDEAEQRLQATISQQGFVDCLQEILSQQAEGRKRRKGGKGKKPEIQRKKQKACPQVPGVATVKPFRKQESGTPAVDMTMEEHTQTVSAENAKKHVDVQPTPAQRKKVVIWLTKKTKGGADKAAKQEETSQSRVSQGGMASKTTDARDEGYDQSREKEEAHLTPELSSEMDIDTKSDIDVESEPKSKASGHPPSTSTDLAQLIESIDAESWDMFKPHLLSHLQGLNLYGNPPSKADTQINDVPPLWERVLTRIGTCNDELAKIPPDNWDRYQLELINFCNSDEIHTMDWVARLRRIKKTVYLSEEAEVMKTSDWERLEGVARLCAFIAENTGPEVEATDPEKTDEWVNRHLKDIRYLKKVTASKERIMGLRV